jgi:hypothetical protein
MLTLNMSRSFSTYTLNALLNFDMSQSFTLVPNRDVRALVEPLHLPPASAGDAEMVEEMVVGQALRRKKINYFCESLDNAQRVAYISTCFDGHPREKG